MRLAPETPTTKELQAKHAIPENVKLKIFEKRNKISDIIKTGKGLIVIAGPCAMTDETDIFTNEAQRLAQACIDNPGIEAAYRVPHWKPRTNPEDWHGLETTDPHLAYSTASTIAEHSWAAEIGHQTHVGRYGDLLTIGWIGSRAVEDQNLLNEITNKLSSLPIGVKNAIDGSIDSALSNIQTINSARKHNDAPAILIYRGGENTRTPNEWAKQYKTAHEATDGKIIVDCAHGSEMAHDPSGQFKKSIQGQVLAIDHLIELAKQGMMPLGIMIEASDAVSPTDPVIPYDLALDGINRLIKNCL